MIEKPKYPGACSVVVKMGQHFIITPKGEEIPCVISTTITDNYNEPTFALVKMYVNLHEVESLPKNNLLDEYYKKMPNSVDIEKK